MKILAILGSPRIGQTDRIVKMFENHLRTYENVDFEYIYLRDMSIQPCRGCAICLENGEEFCPLKDDRDFILEKMKKYYGMIFASPNYSLQVSGLMKNFLDRLCFVFHRPCFFGKTSISIVTQGVYVGSTLVKYLNSVEEFFGCNVCNGINLTIPWGVLNPKINWPEKQQIKIEQTVKNAAENFYNTLSKAKNPTPSMKKLAIFRFTRSAHKFSRNHNCDYEYYKNNVWFDAPYYYDIKLSFHKRIIGALVDKYSASALTTK